MSFKVRPAKYLTYFFKRNKSSYFLTKTTTGDSNKSWKEIPGPTSLPIIQQTHHYLPGGSLYNYKGLDLWTKLYEDYGPITTMKIIFREPSVVLLDADCVGEVARGETWESVRDGLDSLVYHRTVHRPKKTVSKGVAFERGDNWKKYRSMVMQLMLKPKTVQTYRGAFEEVSNDMLKRLRSRRDDQNRMPGDLSQDIRLWTLECYSLISFGKRLNFMDLSLEKDSPQMRLLESSSKTIHYMGELDMKSGLWKIFPTKAFKEAMAVFDERDRWANHVIQKYIDEYKKSKPKEAHHKTILENLIDLDVEFAEVMTGDILLAAVESVPALTKALLYCLAINLDKQDLLRDSLYSNTDNKRYLKACIKETLRVIPISNFVKRKTSKHYHLLGYDIPAGTSVMLCNNYLSKLEKHFPQAEKYIPERWTVDVDHPLSYKTAHRFAYNPFGYGSRVCIAFRVIELQLETLVENIIKNFQVEWIGPPPTFTTSLSIVMDDPVRFTFKDV